MDGKRIKSIRKALGLTQKELGKKVGISYQTISELENGKLISDAKKVLYENAFKQLESFEKGDLEAEERSEYRKTEILDDILFELKEIRTENQKLTEKVGKMQEDNANDKKMNELLRKQLQLAINVLKSLDNELEKQKLSGTEKKLS